MSSKSRRAENTKAQQASLRHVRKATLIRRRMCCQAADYKKELIFIFIPCIAVA